MTNFNLFLLLFIIYFASSILIKPHLTIYVIVTPKLGFIDRQAWIAIYT